MPPTVQAINAKAKKPESYTHQHFPKYVFRRDATGKVVSQLVKEAEFEAAEKAGWVESPDDCDPADESKVSDSDKLDAVLKENARLQKQLQEALASAPAEVADGFDDPSQGDGDLDLEADADYKEPEPNKPADKKKKKK